MAASKENLMSLGHMASTDRNTFTKQRAHSSKNRPLLMQTDFSTQQSLQHLRVIHLQRRWEELKERELTAQQHNRQLLQQFEKAQDTLREMLARNAAMKTIRMEYERYLEESTPRWQQQLKEKTEAAQRKKMEYVRSCLNNTEQEQMTKSSADQPSLLQGLAKKPQKVSASQENHENSHYSQGVSSHLPYVQSSWLTHPLSQRARFTIRVPSQPQGSSHVPPPCLPPPSIFPHPHQSQLCQQLASSSSHHYPWPRHDLPGWASPQPNYPWPWPAGAAGIPSGCGAPWGQLYMEEPPHHERGADVETSRTSSSKRERSGGSRSSHLSQELDIKPVRLSNGHAESSESGRDSSQARGRRRREEKSREESKKREKRGKTQQTSDRDGSSSHESSVTSSAIVIAGVAVAQSSESDTSSEHCSTGGSKRTRTRSGGFAVGLPRMEEVANGRTRTTGGDPGSHNEESESTSEESENQISRSRSENQSIKGSPDDKSHSCREEESKSVSAEVENRVADIENQERSTGAEESDDEEKNEEEGFEDIGEEDDGHDDEEKENSQRNEEQEEIHVEEDDGKVSARKNTANEEEEETGAEEELEDDGDDEDDHLNDEDGENRTQGSASASSEDEEEESEEDENKMGDDKDESAEEEDREGEEEEEEEEQRSNEVEEEERDSEDSIISPQETRLKKIHIIPEEEAEDEEEEEQRGSKTGSSDDEEDSVRFSEEDDIEELLAPQEQTKKTEEKEPKAVDKPEAACDKVEAFQVELDYSTKTDHQSDSDEFDHFYD